MKKPTQKEVYTTVIVLAIAILLISRIFHHPRIQGVAIILLALSLIYYTAAEWLTIGWLKFAEILGNINSKVLMTLVFFIFLVPISFFYRLFNKDSLHLRKTSNPSNYITRNHPFEKKDMEQGW